MEKETPNISRFAIVLIETAKVENWEKVDKKLIDDCKRAYESKSGFVYKIINAFIYSECSSLSKQELAKVCGNDKLNTTNYDRWSVKGSKYKIIKKTGSNRFILDPNIIDILEIKL